MFDAYRDVRILLSTRENLNSPQQIRFRDLPSLRLTPFNPDKPTRVLIHGWTEDEESDIKVETSRELLALYDFNVLFVDWSEGSRTISYLQARNRVSPVGIFLASFLDYLHESGYVDYNRLTVVGFSLGAHMAGLAGKNVRSGRINTIIGLDPAGPLFSVNTPAERLDSGDALYVEALHTNGGAFGSGIGTPIAHADFFPNGGSLQPGCFVALCSHMRAVDYYSKDSEKFNHNSILITKFFLVESIRFNQFFGLRCATATDAALGRCTSEPGAWFAGEPSNFASNTRGIFHFTTNSRAPFATGPIRP